MRFILGVLTFIAINFAFVQESHACIGSCTKTQACPKSPNGCSCDKLNDPCHGPKVVCTGAGMTADLCTEDLGLSAVARSCNCMCQSTTKTQWAMCPSQAKNCAELNGGSCMNLVDPSGSDTYEFGQLTGCQ